MWFFEVFIVGFWEKRSFLFVLVNEIIILKFKNKNKKYLGCFVFNNFVFIFLF